VYEAGRQNREKPIVLCHGFQEHAFSWRHQITALPQQAITSLVIVKPMTKKNRLTNIKNNMLYGKNR